MNPNWTVENRSVLIWALWLAYLPILVKWVRDPREINCSLGSKLIMGFFDQFQKVTSPSLSLALFFLFFRHNSNLVLGPVFENSSDVISSICI